MQVAQTMQCNPKEHSNPKQNNTYMKTNAKRVLLVIAAVVTLAFAGSTSASAYPYHGGYYHNGYYYNHGYYGYHRGYYGYYGYGRPYGHWGYNNGARVWISF